MQLLGAPGSDYAIFREESQNAPVVRAASGSTSVWCILWWGALSSAGTVLAGRSPEARTSLSAARDASSSS
jgi:hypothetical protein